MENLSLSFLSSFILVRTGQERQAQEGLSSSDIVYSWNSCEEANFECYQHDRPFRPLPACLAGWPFP
jgi:hypothetical protein